MSNTSNEATPGFKIAATLVIAIVALMLLLWLSPITSINAGHKGVVTRGGKVARVLDEGYQYKTPVIEKVTEVDVRTQVETAEASAASKDLQTVTAKVAVNYNIAPDKVAYMWNNVGKEYKTVIIDPAIQEAVKAATAKHTAEELITKREAVKDEITADLRDRLAAVGFINLTGVSITDFDFSQSFNAAIEAKVTAEQTALASKNKLEQVKYEAQQQIEQAKAQAESIRIQAQAVTQQGGKDYVQLQWIQAWKEGGAKVPSTLITGSTGSNNFLFDVNK